MPQARWWPVPAAGGVQGRIWSVGKPVLVNFETTRRSGSTESRNSQKMSFGSIRHHRHFNRGRASELWYNRSWAEAQLMTMKPEPNEMTYEHKETNHD